MLMQRQQDAKRLLSMNERKSNVVEEFNVASDLMGLAIGVHGANISNARNVDGVEDVIIDESQRANGHCLFKVIYLKLKIVLTEESVTNHDHYILS